MTSIHAVRRNNLCAQCVVDRIDAAAQWNRRMADKRMSDLVRKYDFKRPPLSDSSIFAFALIFALISYFAISIRAVLHPDEVRHFVDLKRILSIGAGASIFWLAIRHATKHQSGARAQVIAALQISIAGLICLLMTREAYDFATSGEVAQRIGANIRWILMWIGYFVAALSIVFAIEYHQLAQRLHTGSVPHDLPTLPTVATLSAQERTDIQSLLVMLHHQTGYETADPDLHPDVTFRQETRRNIDQLLLKLSATEQN